jgi:deoxyribose-phosphate aldolase
MNDPAAGAPVIPGATATATASAVTRNPGASLDLAWVLAPEVDAAEVERAVAKLPARAVAAPESEAPRLLRALRSIDLTTLSGDDTPARVRSLCEQARAPLPPFLAEAFTAATDPPRTASVCVYHHFLHDAKEALRGSGIPVAVVSAGFPAGLSPLRQRIDEVRASVDEGADEIDAVINRSHVLTGQWEALYDEVRAMREACGAACLKVILATGELGTHLNVARASRLCMLAGADFIKTSSGKETVNATYPAGLVMLRQIAEYGARTGAAVGFKPAGGIRLPAQALEWMWLVEEALGEEWLNPERFRLGASGLLGEIVRRLQGAAAA